MLGGSAPVRSLLAVALGAVALAGCGGGAKQAMHTSATTSVPTATGPTASKSSYQTTAVGVLRPMLQAINAALQAPRQASSWQQLQRQAERAYVTIGKVRPPSDIADLHGQLVKALGNVSSTAGDLFNALSSNNLQAARPLGSRLVSEGQQITSLGNQLKQRGYTQVGAILAGP
jgi:hypothetical protein